MAHYLATIVVDVEADSPRAAQEAVRGAATALARGSCGSDGIADAWASNKDPERTAE